MVKNSKLLEDLKDKLKGKVVVLGIGNTLRSDDALGPILVNRIKGRVPFIIIDAGVSPENYLEKIIGEKPDTVIIIDAVDFGGKPGEFKVLEAKDIKTVNLFTTHNASISLTINYLQNRIKADIIILIIQPKNIVFGGKLSPEVSAALNKLEGWWFNFAHSQGIQVYY